MTELLVFVWLFSSLPFYCDNIFLIFRKSLIHLLTRTLFFFCSVVSFVDINTGLVSSDYCPPLRIADTKVWTRYIELHPNSGSSSMQRSTPHSFLPTQRSIPHSFFYASSYIQNQLGCVQNPQPSDRNFLGRFYFYYILISYLLGRFNQTIIPIPLVGHGMIITKSALRSLNITPSNTSHIFARSWLV